MSTYSDNPYVCGVIAGPATTGCTHLNQFATRIRNTFVEGGWASAAVGAMITITTNHPGGFPVCVLGAGNVAFYRVSIPLIDPIAIVDEDALDTCLTDLGALGRYITVPAQSDREAVHRAVVAAVIKIYGQAGFPLFPIENISDLSTRLAFSSITACIPQIAIGNQLNTSITREEGVGYLFRSQESQLPGNQVELYLAYRQFNPFMGFYYREGGWPGFAITISGEDMSQIENPGEEFKYDTAFGTSGEHPWPLVQTEEGIKIHSSRVAITAGQDLELWVNAYSMLHTPHQQLQGNSFSGFCGALKLKPLEGEDPLVPALWNIRKALVFTARDGGGASLREQNRFQATRVALEFSGTGFAEEVFDTNVPIANWGPLILGSVAETINWEDHANGVVWKGDIAHVAEPWVGCNFFNPRTSLGAPLVAQLWDACIPYRSINLGYANQLTNEPFPWDNQIWRYYQVDKEGIGNIGPPSSLAFRVADLRVYNGSGYVGEILGEVSGVTASGGPFASGASFNIEVTLTEAAPMEGAFVVVHTPGDERVRFNTHILKFADGESLKSIGVASSDLEVAETVTIEVRGTNVITLDIAFLAV